MATFRLAGVSFPNPDGEHRQAILAAVFDAYWPDRIGEVELELVSDDSNEHDQNAVAVTLLRPAELRGKQVGFVPADEALLYRRALERDLVGRAEFERLHCGSGGGISARVRVLRRKAR